MHQSYAWYIMSLCTFSFGAFSTLTLFCKLNLYLLYFQEFSFSHERVQNNLPCAWTQNIQVTYTSSRRCRTVHFPCGNCTCCRASEIIGCTIVHFDPLLCYFDSEINWNVLKVAKQCSVPSCMLCFLYITPIFLSQLQIVPWSRDRNQFNAIKYKLGKINILAKCHTAKLTHCFTREKENSPFNFFLVLF